MTRALDPTDPEVWKMAKAVVHRARASSLHCAVASIDVDGAPHVTPIGSVMLGEPGTAIYFDVFNVALGRNLDRDPRAAILAVDSRKGMWLRALVRGRFDVPPGVRLTGTVGPPRPATAAEVARFGRAVRPALRTRGGRQMWGRPDRFQVREVEVRSVHPVAVPKMTQHLWPAGRVRVS